MKELPTIIELDKTNEWSKIEFIDANYNREIRIIPNYIKESCFNNESVFAPSQEQSLNYIKKEIISDKYIANSNFVEPNNIYFYILNILIVVMAV